MPQFRRLPDVLDDGPGLFGLTLERSTHRRRSRRPGEVPPYHVPPDNPFVSVPEGRSEIWAFGFRNPVLEDEL